jgi:hypothetical protein
VRNNLIIPRLTLLSTRRSCEARVGFVGRRGVGVKAASGNQFDAGA